ncbi:response regulator [Salipaludibacillus agaradhaerens]|uniref:histidine kinase n=1 Tax=Salipaludibacillus agaradhaerens TaxID=76935 RepID=A0A9Q4B572_SALAG|nr:ATP-binding protein [Salipaludibacillus agaradhaerens]MCR6098663.1 response regulator [Salipaludibacillus agaradhaerens]MCR6115670.1 response regulator [Salipaludibacillus agaradhaerens]
MKGSYMWKRKGIRAYFLRTSLLLLTVILFIIGALSVHTYHEQSQLAEKKQELRDKAELTESINSTLNNLVFHGRTYLAFQSEDDLERVFIHLSGLDLLLNQMNAYTLSADEEVLYRQLEEFIVDYEFSLMPQAISFVENDDYEGLREFWNEGTNESVMSYLSRTASMENKLSSQVTNLYDETVDAANFQSFLGLILMGATMLLYMIALSGVLTRLVKPLESLTEAADDLAAGREVTLEIVDRQDELGSLSNAFHNMARSISEKEEELTAQYEELQCQQIELQQYLTSMKTSNEKLELFNQLNHAISLSLNKEAFITSIFNYINKLYLFDKSIFTLTSERIYKARGASEKTVDRFIQSDKSDLIIRLQQDRHVVIKRKSENAEQGMADDPIDVYDLYSGVMDAEKKVMAIFSATRIGQPFSDEEISEIDGIMNRASLALERTVIYEEMETSRKLSQDIIDNLNEGIMFVSVKGEVLQYNEAVCQMVRCEGVPREDNVDLHGWLDKFTRYVQDSDGLANFISKFINDDIHGTMNYQYEVETDQDVRVINVYGTSVYHNQERVGTIFVHRNITKEYELDKMKSELVSTVSHELRTPLSSVLGFTELLLTKSLKPERQKKYLDTIYKEAQRLTNLINNFLDLQRMEAGTQAYTMETKRMDKVVMEVMNNFKHEKQHYLKFVDESLDARVKMDEARIQQVLTNLLSNAIKFSPDGGDITVTLRNLDSMLMVTVEDEGLGIPEEHMDTLFSKFQRIDQHDRKKIGGTGLGLAISREIIENHEGSIWVESELGKGTTFSFNLPLMRHVITATEQEGAPISQKGSVMIVEDDASLALLLSEELKTNRFRVIHHFDPVSAYHDSVQQSFSAIVVDLMLGEEMDGWDLIKKLKETPETHTIPIIISSALDKSEDKMREFGIKDYLTKPYPPDELSKTLLQFVSSNERKEGEVLFPGDSPPSVS